MSENVALEERLTAVERDLAELKDHVFRAPREPMVEKMIGSMSDYPSLRKSSNWDGKSVKRMGPSSHRGRGIMFLLDTDFAVLLQRGSSGTTPPVGPNVNLSRHGFLLPRDYVPRTDAGGERVHLASEARRELVRGYAIAPPDSRGLLTTQAGPQAGTVNSRSRILRSHPSLSGTDRDTRTSFEQIWRDLQGRSSDRSQLHFRSHAATCRRFSFMHRATSTFTIAWAPAGLIRQCVVLALPMLLWLSASVGVWSAEDSDSRNARRLF